FERFDQRMFEVKSADEMTRVNEELINIGGELYEFYVYDMLRSGSVHDDSAGYYLYYFVSDTVMRRTYNDIQSEFRNSEDEEEQTTDAFRQLKYHLPDAVLPERLITYNSAFNYGVASAQDQIG